ncbi:hypothetical protein [Acetilactobacillus jinshanensis]|uniref:Uncharacterized protein n=1 Tax=Acetilactobacillus jinshanensis TaxID=1720083 RepID=A0A4P6ZKP8_9LACO|nr:hypothetical protein [Acetilactobacillus jinshanensis]QBP18361.1 hypothetical protein ELX58_04245 [Acetilactobacillus jinshanensis]URL61226.1 hypothetical protein HGK75_04315 [uncultured bacterium]
MMFLDFWLWILVGLVTAGIMALIFKYLDKCVKSIKKTGNKVWFTCIITVALWVALALVVCPFK